MSCNAIGESPEIEKFAKEESGEKRRKRAGRNDLMRRCLSRSHGVVLMVKARELMKITSEYMIFRSNRI